MPRAASSISPTNAKRTASSPAKRSSRKKQTIQVQDKSQWRASWIPEDATVSLNHMHNKSRSFKLLITLYSRTAKKINGVDRIMPMFLYKERDVEMKAWEKYGGPEGFEKMLNDKAAKYYAKHGTKSGKIFPKPSTYKLASDPALAPCVSIFVYPKDLPDPETSTPNLIRIKEMMEGRGEKWLWDALNNVFKEYESGPRRSERESLMSCAFDTLQDYPRRPTSPPPSDSVSFNALNELLADAPSGYHGPGIEVYYDHFTGDESVDWIKPYKDNVYDCLDKVLNEHGVDGLEKARWLVYDKYVECKMGGLWYYKSDNSQGPLHANEYRWSDSAKFWLHERED
ncbi:hypothetical protein BJ912DRAFT_950960 [Pholiota molesta]|nr:hypothetical protein BJ912DRAFT_950960 [Pholiota molesta]